MEVASEGFLTGTKVIIAVMVATMLVLAFGMARSLYLSHTADVVNDVTMFSESDFRAFDDNDVSGYDLWDQFNALSGRRASNQYFTMHVVTGTADIVWTSDRPIGEAISDRPSDVNYIGEDNTYHCTLIRSNDDYGEIIGIYAQLII